MQSKATTEVIFISVCGLYQQNINDMIPKNETTITDI